MREWEIGAVENIHGALPYIQFAPILALVGVGVNRIGKVRSHHTLEHLESPLAVLTDHWRVLKPGGVLIVECRNIGAISDESIVGEWFAPNRNYHFSQITLSRMLNAAGFELVENSNANDRDNILFAATKSDCERHESFADPLEVHSARALISFYKSARRRNLSLLRPVVAEMNTLARRGMAICGSGRLLDTLMHYGGLDRDSFLFFSSEQLQTKLAPNESSLESNWSRLKDAKPGVVVVMTDAHADEIAHIASHCSPHTEIIHYSELVFRAYDRLAA